MDLKKDLVKLLKRHESKQITSPELSHGNQEKYIDARTIETIKLALDEYKDGLLPLNTVFRPVPRGVLVSKRELKALKHFKTRGYIIKPKLRDNGSAYPTLEMYGPRGDVVLKVGITPTAGTTFVSEMYAMSNQEDNDASPEYDTGEEEEYDDTDVYGDEDESDEEDYDEGADEDDTSPYNDAME
jgi:hypothetical protein